MNKKTKGVLAGVAGIALLAGGTTFATWSETLTQDGATITSGKLDITGVSTPVWYDVTAGRPDADATTPVTGRAGHTIDAATWRTVPGDSAEATYSFDVALEGDNLAAQLDVSNLRVVAANGGTAAFKIYDGTGNEITSKLVGGRLTFVGPDAGVDPRGVAGSVAVDTTTAADVHVVVTVDFASDEAEDMSATVYQLGEVGGSLTQVAGA